VGTGSSPASRKQPHGGLSLKQSPHVAGGQSGVSNGGVDSRRRRHAGSRADASLPCPKTVRHTSESHRNHRQERRSRVKSRETGIGPDNRQLGKRRQTVKETERHGTESHCDGADGSPASRMVVWAVSGRRRRRAVGRDDDGPGSRASLSRQVIFAETGLEGEPHSLTGKRFEQRVHECAPLLPPTATTANRTPVSA
jgi:hypothetical protein